MFMAKQIDNKIKSLATGITGESKLRLLKRFLDDLFLIFKGTTKELHEFFNLINKIHPAIKFTMTPTKRKNKNPKET